MAAQSLRDRCTVNTNFETDVFVGVQCKNGNFHVSFPLGFNTCEDEKGLRKDILLLMNVLAQNTKSKNSEIRGGDGIKEVSASIQAYLFIISDYYLRGYYKETENTNAVTKRGKINWSRTIKTQKAYIQDKDVFYLDFITRSSAINDNELITIVHEYCVYESFEKMGWLFSSYMPQKPRIKFNKNLFMSIVNKKNSQTFNDKTKQLFHNMLLVISSMGDDDDIKDFKYGTSNFEYVWENLIDNAFGIKNKYDFYPKTHWILEGKMFDNSYLEPDTIMFFNDRLYVLDAKYYRYGWSKIPSHLPDSSSVHKQITYGEYIAESEKYIDSEGSHPTVYNAFLMPYNSYGKAFHTENSMHLIGVSISEWKKNDKTYENVVGILIDIKYLMQGRAKKSDITDLAALIENCVQKNIDKYNK